MLFYFNMPIQLTNTTQRAKIILIIEFLLVSYLLFSLTDSVYKSYQIDVHIKNYEAENARIEEENKINSENYEYYSSDAYIEKIAKQNLGLINHGEELILIPSDNFDETTEQGTLAEDENDALYPQLSNPAKWWKLFFDM